MWPVGDRAQERRLVRLAHRDHPLVADGQPGPAGGDRLGERGVDAAVDDPVGLAKVVAHLDAAHAPRPRARRGARRRSARRSRRRSVCRVFRHRGHPIRRDRDGRSRTAPCVTGGATPYASLPMPLSADAQALLELILAKGQSYEDLAGLLDVPEDEVRDRARGCADASWRWRRPGPQRRPHRLAPGSGRPDRTRRGRPSPARGPRGQPPRRRAARRARRDRARGRAAALPGAPGGGRRVRRAKEKPAAKSKPKRPVRAQPSLLALHPTRPG